MSLGLLPVRDANEIQNTNLHLPEQMELATVCARQHTKYTINPQNFIW